MQGGAGSASPSPGLWSAPLTIIYIGGPCKISLQNNEKSSPLKII